MVNHRYGALLYVYLVILHCMIALTLSLHHTDVHVYPRNCTHKNALPVSNQTNEVTLEEALKNLDSQSTLYLQPGVHCIENFDDLIQNKSNVSIIGESLETVTITCGENVGLAFIGFSELKFENVAIDGCGFSNADIYNFLQALTSEANVEVFYTLNYYVDNRIALMLGDCYNLNMTNVVIENTRGLGLLGINIVGSSELNNVILQQNTPSSKFYYDDDPVLQERLGGGALFIYQDYKNNSLEEAVDYSSHLLIKESNFLYNSYSGVGVYYVIYNRLFFDRLDSQYLLGHGGGLSIVLTQYYYGVNVTAEQCLFLNNTARFGSGLFVSIFAGVLNSHVVIADSTIQRNGIAGDLVSDRRYHTHAAGMAVVLDVSRPELEHSQMSPFLAPSTVHITRTNVTQNRAAIAGGLFILSLYYPILGKIIQTTVNLNSCIFEQNSALSSSAISARELKASPIQLGIKIILENVKIRGNSLISSDQVTTKEQSSGTVQLRGLSVTIGRDTEISKNIGTGLCLLDSGFLMFEGSVLISKNEATYGGGLKVEPGWIVVITNNSDVHFSYNVATIFGGGIFSEPPRNTPGTEMTDCFLNFGQLSIFCYGDLSFTCHLVFNNLNASLRFYGNKAPLGSMIYGSTFERCPWTGYLRQKIAPDLQNETILSILHREKEFIFFDSSPNNTETVSTSTNTISITNVTKEEGINAMPGQTFYLGVQTLDSFNRNVPTVISSNPQIIHSNVNVTSRIGSSNYYFVEGDMDPVNVPIRVYGGSLNTSLNITLVSINSFAQSQFVVNLVNCHNGYNYINNSCVCDSRIEESQLNCTDEGNFVVPTGAYIGKGPDGSLLLYYCNFDYCLQGRRVVSPQSFETQCNTDYHRRGIGCGQCQEGYSVTFGSNRCAICSNTTISLILVVAVIGIAIILIILILEITVSDGFLNGVLFYVNIVGLYITIFSNGTDTIYFFPPLAWLNLGLGFQSCFYNGMTALQRSAINFIFPFYLYALMAMIVFIAKKSEFFAARLSYHGFSPTRLFATLLIMTYSCLMQNCIEVLGFNVVETLNNNTYYLWRIDPNQEMFRGAHIPLGLFSIILLLFFIIPAPLILIFPSRVFGMKTLRKYAPLYDVFWAPFKPEYRFWVGLRLLLRIFPFIFAYFLTFPFNLLTLVTFTVLLIYVQGLLQPFKLLSVNAADLLLLSTIVPMAAGPLYFNTYNLGDFLLVRSNRELDIDINTLRFLHYSTFLGIAYVIITVITIWYILKRFPTLKTLLKEYICCCKRMKDRERDLSTQYEVEDSPAGAISVIETSLMTVSTSYSEEDERLRQTPTVATFALLREPLLETSGSAEIVAVENPSKTV